MTPVCLRISWLPDLFLTFLLHSPLCIAGHSWLKSWRLGCTITACELGTQSWSDLIFRSVYRNAHILYKWADCKTILWLKCLVCDLSLTCCNLLLSISSCCKASPTPHPFVQNHELTAPRGPMCLSTNWRVSKATNEKTGDRKAWGRTLNNTHKWPPQVV